MLLELLLKQLLALLLEMLCPLTIFVGADSSAKAIQRGLSERTSVYGFRRQVCSYRGQVLLWGLLLLSRGDSQKPKGAPKRPFVQVIYRPVSP